MRAESGLKYQSPGLGIDLNSGDKEERQCIWSFERMDGDNDDQEVRSVAHWVRAVRFGSKRLDSKVLTFNPTPPSSSVLNTYPQSDRFSKHLSL